MTTPTATTTSTPGGQLPHTGAGGTGILAGAVAAMLAAGTGLTVLARKRDEDEDESQDVAPA
ncbi:MAG: LPXTG cell wall anchor domain-containing protein [Candidatus Nanopelagicales bacterium]